MVYFMKVLSMRSCHLIGLPRPWLFLLVPLLSGFAVLSGSCQPVSAENAPEPREAGAVAAEPLPWNSLESFEGELAAANSSGNIEPFWHTVISIGQVPLIFGETVVFLYRGNANAVAWCADFAPGDPQLAYMNGERIGDTDLWMLKRHFPRDARLSYRISLNGNQKILLDPLNRFRNMEGSGPVSELRMPGYRPPKAVQSRRYGIHRGDLGEEQAIRSQSRGYTVNYRVYTPAGYQSMGKLPVIYVVDGQEYANGELGGMVNVLDNLIADRSIVPVIAVFIDQRDTSKKINRRNDEFTSIYYEKFLVTELVPAIDAAFRTDPRPARRALLGDSLGGLFTFRTVMRHPDCFGLAALQSPAPALEAKDYDLVEKQPRLPIRFFISVGTLGDIEIPAGLLRNLLGAKGYPVEFREVNDGHSWGHYRTTLAPLLINLFGQRGL